MIPTKPAAATPVIEPRPGEHGRGSRRKPSDADWFAANPDASSRVRLATPAELDGVPPDLRATRVLVVRTRFGGLARFPIRLTEPRAAVEALRQAAEQGVAA